MLYGDGEDQVEDAKGYVTGGHVDEEWEGARREIVVETLKQAIGCGRSYLDLGVPVVVVSQEHLGMVGVERREAAEVGKVGGPQYRVLEAVVREYQESVLQDAPSVRLPGLMTEAVTRGTGGAMRGQTLISIF